MLTLNPDELHLWFAFSDEIQNTELMKAYQNLMTTEEKAQQQRFHFAKHRHQYLVTRALVRTTLSRYCHVKPGDWRFLKNDYGKPKIKTFEGIPELRFNLSHTENLIICGVVLKQEIGVDVEYMERKGATVEIADRFFSQQEVNDLHTLGRITETLPFF
jgi:4'-phosphopantetheinyl transferase